VFSFQQTSSYLSVAFSISLHTRKQRHYWCPNEGSFTCQILRCNFALRFMSLSWPLKMHRCRACFKEPRRADILQKRSEIFQWNWTCKRTFNEFFLHLPVYHISQLFSRYRTVWQVWMLITHSCHPVSSVHFLIQNFWVLNHQSFLRWDFLTSESFNWKKINLN